MNRAMLRIALATGLTPMMLWAQAAPAPAPTPRAMPAPAPMAAPAIAGESYGNSYLGIDSRDVTSDRLSALKLKEERGVEVTMVDGDAPACKAGLKEHDVILTFNGNNVQSVEQLRRLIRETPPGRTVSLGISRDGQPMALTATLGDRRKMYSQSVHVVVPKVEIPRIEIPRIEIPSMDFGDMDMPAMTVVTTSRRNGLSIENLTPQLGDFFGVRNGEGVLVRSVEKGSKGEAAGFRAGDVIVKVAGEHVSNMSDWSRQLRQHRGSTISIGIVRDKKEQAISLPVPGSSGDRSEWRGDWDVDVPTYTFDNEKFREQMDQVREQIREATREATRENSEWQKELQKEMARIGPEIQKSMEQSRRAIEKAMREQQKAMRDMRIDIDEQ